MKATYGVICKAYNGNMTSNKNAQITCLVYPWEVISITCCLFCTGYFVPGSHMYTARLFHIDNHINSIKFSLRS